MFLSRKIRTALLGTPLALLMSNPSRAQSVVVREDLPAAAVAPAAVTIEQVPDEVAAGGRVLRTKQVDVRGTTEKVLVALIDTGDGQRQIVELGPALNFKYAPVVTGEQIAVRGRRMMIGKLDVLVATHANIAGHKILIERDVPAAAVAVATPAGYPVTEQVLKLEGRIAHLRTSPLRGSREEHLVAEVVNRGGRAIVVDLGSPGALWRADIKQGEWVTIRGQEMNVNNRPALLALEINKNGIPYLINRDLVHDRPADAVEAATTVKPPVVVVPATVTSAVVAPAAVTPATVVAPTTVVTPAAPVVAPAPVVVPPAVVP